MVSSPNANTIKRIAITPGEPAGIGPDLVITIVQKDWPMQLVIIASKSLMVERAKQLNLPLIIKNYDPEQPATPHVAGTLTIISIDLPEQCIAGELNVNNGKYVVETLRIASEKNIDGEFDAVVTGPVHKGLINTSLIKRIALM